tara:strand:+ start:386 stop:520 length:135 start_codon:yes stop_codon:yes gene_type:complete
MKKNYGISKVWHDNGQLKSEANYKDGNIVRVKCWDEKGNKIDCP